MSGTGAGQAGTPACEALAVVGDPGARALALRALRHGAAAAADAEEAARLLSGPEASRGLRLLLLDLPPVAAYEVLRRVRGDPRTSGLPVVVLGAAGGNGAAHEAYALGANSYVVTPADDTGYADTVARVADYWLGVNRFVL